MLAEWKMKKEVVSFLERKVPDHIDFSYDKLTISLIKGNIAFKDVAVVSLGKQTSSCEIKVDAEMLSINGLDYWKILFQKSIYIKSLTLTKPHLNFKTCPENADNEVASKSNPIKLLKEILIEEIIFDKGRVEIWDSNEEVALIAVDQINLSLKEVATDPEIITKYVPFTFSKYTIEILNLNAPLGEFEALKMQSMVMNNATIDITNISLATKLTKDRMIVLSYNQSRSQHKNKETVFTNFIKLLEKGLRVSKHRKKTKPTFASKRKRLDSKKRTSEKKNNRRPPKL